MLGCRSTRPVTLKGPAATDDHMPAGPEAWRLMGRRGGSSAGLQRMLLKKKGFVVPPASNEIL
jgi:hypothetical protein